MQPTHSADTYTNRQSEPVSGFTGNLSPATMQSLRPMLRPSSYDSHIVLYSERDPATSVIVVLEGEVKLSINSADGRRLIHRIARKGDILGIASALSGCTHEMTAETLYPCKLAFIPRNEFMNFLLHHPEAWKLAAEELSRQYAMACEQLRNVALSASVPEKLARLLLDWSEGGQTTDCGTRFRFSLTHEEIGEFIGASRETVTRTLSTFKHRRLVTCQGATLTIPNRTALATYAHC